MRSIEDAALPPHQMDALLSLIADESPRVRRTCVREIVRLGPQVLEPLRRQARETSDRTLRAATTRLLRKIQVDADLVRIVKHIRKDQPILEEGVELLARIHDPLLPEGDLGRRFNAFSAELEPRVAPGTSIRAATEILIAYVHDELGLRGSKEDYYDPLNSFLNKVLDRGVGIPITLGAVYLLLARRVGIPLFGFNIPGHFLTGYVYDGEYEFLDAFDRGRRLSIEQVIETSRSHGFDLDQARIRIATDRDILVRMTNNLVVILEKEDPSAWLAAILEVRHTLISTGASA